MELETVLLNEMLEGIYSIQINRVKQKNSINARFVLELSAVLDVLAEEPKCKIIVLEGTPQFFCIGMDFNEYVDDSTEQKGIPLPEQFISLLRKISNFPKISVAKVEGKATAGGVGLAAACDYVLASDRALFNLSEALWGLLPCMILPHLIKRVGYWTAYQMTITSKSYTAKEAKSIHLADQIVSDENMEQALKLLLGKFIRLNSTTVAEAKQYFNKMWYMSEDVEQVAIDEIKKLAGSELVRKNIERFERERKFPWE